MASSTALDNADSRNLIVNYIPPTITEEQLRSMFLPFGAIESCKVVIDKLSGKGLGYGFVKFVEASGAEAAIESLNGRKIENKTIKVSFARPSSIQIQNTNLYVSQIPVTWEKEDLNAYFAPYGSIIDSKVLRDSNTGQGRGVGFVRFDTRPQSDQALHALNNSTPPGASQPIRIKYAESKDAAQRQYRNMMAPGLGAGGPFRNVGASLRFSPMGGMMGGLGLGAAPLGMGMGMGVTPTVAMSAGITPTVAMAMNPGGPAGFDPSGGLYQSMMPLGAASMYTPPMNLPVPLSHSGPPLSSAMPSGLGDLGGASNGSNMPALFVYNLPQDADDSLLYKLFSPHGAISSVKIIRDQAQLCKGYGFVHMSRYADALQAINMLNGTACGSKTLQVSFKKDKPMFR